MARRNRTCICCNERYEYCPTCGNDRYKPAWLRDFCSEDCKTLWETATKFNMKMLDKKESAKILSGLKLKDKSEYVECVQEDLKNILGESKAPVAKSAAHEVVEQKK